LIHGYKSEYQTSAATFSLLPVDETLKVNSFSGWIQFVSVTGIERTLSCSERRRKVSVYQRQHLRGHCISDPINV
jgi:hypothetical protein